MEIRWSVFSSLKSRENNEYTLCDVVEHSAYITARSISVYFHIVHHFSTIGTMSAISQPNSQLSNDSNVLRHDR